MTVHSNKAFHDLMVDEYKRMNSECDCNAQSEVPGGFWCQIVDLGMLILRHLMFWKSHSRDYRSRCLEATGFSVAGKYRCALRLLTWDESSEEADYALHRYLRGLIFGLRGKPESAFVEFNAACNNEPYYDGKQRFSIARDIAMKQLRRKRMYGNAPLPTLSDWIDPSRKHDILLKLYEQICVNWRMLVDVRFKLLALVPVVSIAVLTGVLSTEGFGKGLPSHIKIGLCLFGFILTSGLAVYDRRNSELHDDLISRGRRIEYELGIDTGQFRGRLSSISVFVTHDVATKLIYISSLLAWLLGFFVIIVSS